MVTKVNVTKILFSFLALILLVLPRLCYADWSVGIGVGNGYHHDDRRYYGWHDRPHYGWRTHYLPAGYFTIWVGGARYFYYDGLYYAYVDGDYVLVDPPIGAYVSAIPPDFQAASINGRIYYSNGGVYYVLTPRGYRVVPAPVVYAQPQQVIVQAPTPPAPAVESAPDSFPINIPNNSGGYTTVVIKRSGNGYVGPQGEFYASFPTVTQLKAMYVK